MQDRNKQVTQLPLQIEVESDYDSEDENYSVDSDSLMDVYIGIKIFLSDNEIDIQKLRQLIKDHKLENKLNQTSAQLDQYDNTILHMAIANESPMMYESIIDAAHDFINPNITDNEGKTLLILAAKMRNSALVKKLLVTKFKDNIDVNEIDKNGFAAIDYAYALGDADSITALNKHGAIADYKRYSKLPCHTDEDLLALFSSVGIDGLRDEHAEGNTTTEFKSDGSKELAILSKKVIDSSLSYLKMQKTLDPSQNSFVDYYQGLSQQLSGISLVERCRIGQLQVTIALAITAIAFFKPQVQSAKVNAQLANNNHTDLKKS